VIEELLFWLALGVIGYYVTKRSGGNVGEKIKQAIEGASKVVTYVLIVLLFAFLAGMFYAFFVLGCVMSGWAFWLPIILFFLLVIYYYL